MISEKYSKANKPALELSFKAGISSFAAGDTSTIGVDIEKREIKGAILIAVGEAQGHDVFIDETFIDEFLAAAKKMKSIKCNLGHNYENSGMQLGRITDFYKDTQSIRGTLKVYASADKSPFAPNMGSWLLELVNEDPEAAMMSVSVDLKYFFQRDENGNEIKVWEDNAEGRWISPNYDMPIYARFAAIRSCDVVAEGALTDAMFSQNTQVMPQTKGFFAELVAAFNEILGINKGKTPNNGQLNNDNNTEIDMSQEELDKLNARLEAAEKANGALEKLTAEFAEVKKGTAELNTKLEATEKRATDLATQLDAAQKENAKLAADFEAFKNEAADEHAAGKRDSGKGNEDKQKDFAAKYPKTAELYALYDID